MRKSILLCLMLFSLSLPAFGQDDGFPLCSSAELAYVLEQEAEFDALMDLALADEDESNFILAYSAAQVEWREELWAGLPPCAEAIKAAALLSESTSDIAAQAALTYAGLPLSANPYLTHEAAHGEAHERVAAYFDAIALAADGGSRSPEPAPGERSLPSCEFADFEALLEALRASEDLMVRGTESSTLGALTEYAGAMLNWRDGMWALLMPCDQALKLGKLMSQTAGDIVSGYALVFAGAPKADNPYSELLQDQLNELGKYMESILVYLSVERTAKTLEADSPALPACSADDLEVGAARLAPLSEMVAASSVDKSLDDLLDYIDAMLSWREALWSDAPLCAEVLEIFLVAAQAANDYATAFALAYAGRGLNNSPYIRLSMDGFNEARLWRQEMAKGAEGSQAPAQTESLPHCAEADDRALQVNATLIGVFWSMLGDIDTRDDLLAFAEDEVELREDIWRGQPLCQEAIHGARLALQLIGDIVPTAALFMFAGAPADDIPYLSAITKAADQVNKYADASEGG